MTQGIGICLIVLALLTLLWSPNSFLTVVPGFLVGVFLTFLSRLQSYLAFKRGGAMVQDRFEVEISDLGMKGASSDTSSQASWSAFKRYSESKNLFLIYRSDLFFNIVPKSVLAPGEEEVVRSLLEEHLGAATRAYRRKIKPGTWLFLVWLVIMLIFLVLSMVRTQRKRSEEVREGTDTSQIFDLMDNTAVIQFNSTALS